MVYLGADHRGFDLKEKLKLFLRERGYEFEDLGNAALDKNDDYTDFARRVAFKISENQSDKGILICGSGAGVTIVANKVDGVRAALASSPEEIRAARQDDDVNVLTLAADFIPEDEAQEIVLEFLTAAFSGEEKYKKRLNDIADLEKNN